MRSPTSPPSTRPARNQCHNGQQHRLDDHDHPVVLLARQLCVLADLLTNLGAGKTLWHSQRHLGTGRTLLLHPARMNAAHSGPSSAWSPGSGGGRHGGGRHPTPRKTHAGRPTGCFPERPGAVTPTLNRISDLTGLMACFSASPTCPASRHARRPRGFLAAVELDQPPIRHVRHRSPRKSAPSAEAMNSAICSRDSNGPITT